MTEASQLLPILAIVALVGGLIYMQRRLSSLEGSEQLRRQQQQLNLQMRRFAEVTMRILGGEEALHIAPQIAATIAETTPFSRVYVALCNGKQGMDLLGHAGLSEKEAGEAASVQTEIAIAQLQSLAESVPISGQSRRVQPHSLKLAGGRQWPNEESVLVFMSSTRGASLGVIVLSGQREEIQVNAATLVGIELLASHIALNIENTIAKKRTFQSEKLEGMGQLVAGVAHELNNPLTAVLGYTEILAEKTDDASVRYDLSVMRREALRMKRIIESLQQFSRKQRVEREKVSLITIIEDTLQSRADEVREQKIEIVKQVDPALPAIVANQALIDQVFQHVFANAMDAVHTAGLKRILIEARALGNQVHLQVSDSGPGFKDAGRVFDPFYTTKGPGKGTGLGLSLCYGIIRDHGGEITASNLHPLGACISIQLPLVSIETRTQSPDAAAPVIR